MKYLVSWLMLLAAVVCNVSGIAVMSVDLGSEWMKVAFVSPGVPMEIALNKESKRKTPVAVAYRDGIRTFGEDAQQIGVRFPKYSYQYILDLIGKDINNPMVKLYQERFPYYKIVADSDRNTVLFQHSDDTFYSPEELLAQILKKAKEFAETAAGQPIKECVLTVPAFFNQVERKSMILSAELAGLKVLQLINDYTAVGLNYAVFNQKAINETAQHLLFYDMGASKTTAAIIKYQLVKNKQVAYNENIGSLHVLGVGYDRRLGGLEMSLRLRDYLAKKFDSDKKLKSSILSNPRANAKLFKEAQRLKTILSANNEYLVQIESLFEDHDFKTVIKREDFEGLIGDLLEKVTKPVEMALKTAQLTVEEISQVVLVGAGTRVPKVQEILTKFFKKDLSKNLNFDESATMGAVYKGAELSTGFKVKKFLIKDSVLFPICINFEREGKRVQKNLFGLNNNYPQKKMITFNKFNDNFDFQVNYGDLSHLNEIDSIGSLNLSSVSISGVQDVLNKHHDAEFKGIKTHFVYDESGILNLTLTEATFEKTTFETESESPLSKLGSTISKLFSSGDLETEQPKNETGGTENNKNDTDSSKMEEKKPKILNLKEVLGTSEVTKATKTLSEVEFDRSLGKISELDRVDQERIRRETALNTLETIVIDAKTKLDTPEYSECATETEKESILRQATQILDWLYEDGAEASLKEYETRIGDFTKLTNDVYARHWEHSERPEALKALKNMLEQSQKFLDTSRNLTEKNPDKNVFTENEVNNLGKVIDDIEKWESKALKEQAKLKKSDPIHLTVKSITEKMAVLDREVKYLVNKLKSWRPKVVEKPVKEEKVEADKSETEKEEGDKKDREDEKKEEAEVTEEKEAEVEAEAEADETTETPSENLSDNTLKSNANPESEHSEL